MNLFTKLFRSRDKPKNYLSRRLSFLFEQTSAGRSVFVDIKKPWTA